MMTDNLQDAIEIWFPIEKDADGFPQSQDWEQLWAWPAKGGYRIDNIPFFVDAISCGDIVSVVKGNDGLFRFEAVVARGGNSTHRLWLADEFAEKSGQILSDLRSLGCGAEVTLGRLIAVDVSPCLEERLREFLLLGRQRGYWELQEED
jgi:hypothetical protein